MAKKLRKILSFMFALALIVSLSVTAFAAPGDPPSVTINHNVSKTYNHVDVRLDGSLTIDRQTNGVSDAGYPTDIDVTVSNVSGNYKIGDTEYQINNFTQQGYEWRKLNLQMSWPDSVSISCTLTDGEGNTYPFSYTFTGAEIEAANDECDDHSGFDFDIASEDIVNVLTHTVTFKTEEGGTIGGGIIDIVHSGILDNGDFPSAPTTAPDTGYEFDGWYDSTDTKVTSFPSTVIADTVWTAKWTQQTYPVTYTYVSGTDGEDLPSAISTTTAPYAVSDSTTYPVGATVNRNNPSSTAYNVVVDGITTGTWALSSWSTDSAVMDIDGINFEGTWTYTPATKYKVTYEVTSTENPNYGTLPDEVSYFANDTVTVAANLTTTDTTNGALQGTWTFNGWKDGDSTVGTTFLMPAEDVNLTGSWTFVETGKYSVTYTITGVAPDNCTPAVPNTPAIYYPGAPVTFLGELTTTDTTNGSAKGFWTFDGWYTADVTVTEGSFTMPDGNVEFEGTWSFTVYPSFTIEKVDGDGELITSSPAEFTLYNDDDEQSLYGTYSTGSDGSALVDGVAPGTYFMKETKAPNGYNGDSTQWTVIVGEAQYATRSVNAYQPSYDVAVYGDNDENLLNEDDVLTVVNTLKPTPPPYNPPPVIITTDPEYGTLTVVKKVTGENAPADERFSITVQFSGMLNTILYNGTTHPDGLYTLSLAAGESGTFSNIPLHTSFTVTEALTADQTDGGWTAPAASNGSIPNTTPVTVTMNNAYEAGVLEEYDEDEEDDETGVLGDSDTEVLPQTGGIAFPTLLAFIGLSLVALGSMSYVLLRKRYFGKSR